MTNKEDIILRAVELEIDGIAAGDDPRIARHLVEDDELQQRLTEYRMLLDQFSSQDNNDQDADPQVVGLR